MEVEPPLQRTLAFYGYTLSFALGVVMYVAWGILYNSWNFLELRNLGVYSVVVILVGFGLVGMLLYAHPSTEELQ